MKIRPPMDLNGNERFQLKNTQLEILDYFCEFCDKNNLTYYLFAGTLLGAVRHKGFIPWDDDIDICMPYDDYYKFLEMFPKDGKYFVENRLSDKEYFYHFSKVMKSDTKYVEYAFQKVKFRQSIFIDVFPIYYVPEQKGFKYYSFYFFSYILYKRSYPKMLTINNSKKRRKASNKMMDVLTWILLWWCPRKTAAKWRDSYLKKHTRKKSKIISVGSSLAKRYDAKLYEGKQVVEFENRSLCAPKLLEENLISKFGKNYMQYPPKEEQIPHHYLVEFKS